MALKRLFPKDEVKRRTDMFMERVYDQSIKSAQFVGEKYIIDARTGGTYNNQTTNLRNSIGYAIVKDGFLYNKAIPSKGYTSVTGKKLTGTDGPTAADQHINSLVGKYSGRHVALICVAGMEYASRVEDRGLSVVTPFDDIALERFKSALVKIANRGGFNAVI